MRYDFGRTIVISLGGSVVCPDGIDILFLKRFKKFLQTHLRGGRKFVLVVGGGRIARAYTGAAKKVSLLTRNDEDWLGIHATRLNAHLIRTIFRSVADPVIVDTRHKIARPKKALTVAAGWHPGWSTDFVSVALAKDFGVKEVVIAGKPEYVYDKDPARFRSARPFHELSWRRYRGLIPKKWIPGAHAPVDPVAAQFAERHSVSAFIVGGKDLKNLGKLLEGRGAQGTHIR